MKRLVGLFVGKAGELKEHAEEVLGERVHLPVTCECMNPEEMTPEENEELEVEGDIANEREEENHEI